MLSDSRQKLIKQFLKEVGFEFCSVDNISVALTHSSCAFETGLSIDHYERFEFLGDAVLKLLASEHLFKKFPEYREGELTRIRAILVSDKTIAKIARKINLDKYILMGEKEKKSGGLKKDSILACAFEAFLGAVYLEGYVSKLDKFLYNLYEELIESIDKNEMLYNPKAILQEYLQDLSKELPKYITIKEEGLAHKKTFTVSVLYQDKELAQGSGLSKKQAETQAALQACKNLNIMEKRNKNGK